MFILFFSYCDGRVLITDCSGLAIISVHPIVESEFHMYTWRGTIWDGEGLAGNFFFHLKLFLKNERVVSYSPAFLKIISTYLSII